MILACAVFVGIWIYRALALAYPDALTTPTQPLISLSMGLSVTLAGIRIVLFALMGMVAFVTLGFAVVGFKVGLIGFGVVVLGGLWTLAAVLQFFPCKVVAHLISYCCLFLTGGRLTPYMNLTEIKKEREEQAERNDAQGRLIAYHPQPEKEKKVNRIKVHSLLFVGDLGSDFFPFLAQDFDALGARDTVLSSGVINPAKPEADLLTLCGTRSLSPTRQDLQQAHDTARKDDDTEAHVYRTLCTLTAQKLIAIHTAEGLKHEPAVFVLVIDKRKLCPAGEVLKTLHEAFPAAKVVVITAVTAADVLDTHIQTGLTLLQTLKHDGVLAVTLVFDDLACPFLQNRQDKATLYRFQSRAIVSLLVAKKHYWYNLAPSEVLERLSKQSAFATVAFASAPVPAGPLPARYGVTKVWPGMQGEKGVGDVDMTITTLKGLIRQVSDRHDPKHESTRSLPVAASGHEPSFLVYHVPLTKREEEKLEKVRRELAFFAGTHFPLATLLLSRSQGVPYGDKAPASYLVGVSRFYSVHRDDFLAEQTIEPEKEILGLPEPQYMASPPEQREEEAEPVLAPYTVEDEYVAGNGSGNGHVAPGQGRAKPGKRPKSTPAKRDQPRGQKRSRAGAGQPDPAQESSIKRNPGRPRNQPAERR